MIKKRIRKHSLKKTYCVTCEQMTRTEALDWIYSMLKKGNNLVDFKIEDYCDGTNTVRCVIEYN